MKVLIVTFALAAACATSQPAETTAANTANTANAANAANSATPRDCGAMVPAVAAAHTDVRTAPDPTSNNLVTLSSATPVCAASNTSGFGYRRVQLADGRIGFVDETALQQ
jgi:hypothetical protein